MLETEAIKKMCAAPGPGMAYYRPFVCKGAVSDVDIFLVGINPATPIMPTEMDLDRYFECLLDYDQFLAYYKHARKCKGKPPMSRTRTGIDSLVRWLERSTSRAIVETNVITYPTADIKTLQKVPDRVKDRGKAIFLALLVGFEPGLMIIHGKKAVELCVPLLEQGGLQPMPKVNVNEEISLMEQKSPLFRIRFKSGKECRVVACRHLRYYGKCGKSFQRFREVVLSPLTS